MIKLNEIKNFIKNVIELISRVFLKEGQTEVINYVKLEIYELKYLLLFYWIVHYFLFDVADKSCTLAI